MQNNISRNAAPSQSANDNGPLTSGQVKVLKMSIAIMGFLIVAALLLIVGRVIYLASVKKSPAQSVAAISSELAAQHRLALPSGAVVKNMSLQQNLLLVHYQTTSGPGAAILDLTTGKTVSRVTITTEVPSRQ